MTNNHETTSESGRIEALAAGYRRRAATLDLRDRDLSRKDDAWLAEPLNEMVAAPARTARDFAAKIVAHANLLGLHDDGECMSIVEASAIRDARALALAQKAIREGKAGLVTGGKGTFAIVEK